MNIETIWYRMVQNGTEWYGMVQYWKLEDSGYADDRWSEDLTIRVSLRW